MLRETLDAKALAQLVSSTLPAEVAVNQKFINGDHWQDSTGWIGPRPAPGELGEQEALAIVKAGFTSSNRIEEVCDRHAAGVLGREPTWGFTLRRALKEDEEPQDAEQALIDQAEAALTEWWNERGVQDVLYNAIMNVAWGRRSVVRVFVPAGLREADGRVVAQPVEGEEANPLAEALSKIYVEVLSPANAHVHEDLATRRKMGIALMKNDADEDVVEVTYVDEAGATFVDVITGDAVQKSEAMQLGGEVLMYELRRRLLITEQVRQQQRAHNLALSTLPRNIVTAGFLERMILNAQMPGQWELDPDTKEPIRFIPAKLSLGPGKTTFLQGSTVETDEVTGKKTLAKPEVVYREPIPVEPAIAAARATYLTILEEAQQAHVLLNTEGDISGRSRVEARRDFESSLKVTKPVADRAGRWLLETVLRLAETIISSGATSGTWSAALRADFSSRLDAGAMTAEERKQNVESMKAGVLPQEDAIAAEGIDDVDAALARINAQDGVALDVVKRRAEIVEILTRAGASLKAAALGAGFNETEAAAIAAGSEFDENEDRPAGAQGRPQPTPDAGAGNAEA